MFLAQIEHIADRIDALTDWVGRATAWLVLVVVVLLFAQLPLREVFGGGHILANDFGQIAHAAVFMFGLSYALRWDRHVRMDIFYRRMSPRGQAAVNLGGTALFLLPWCTLMVWFGWSYAVRSAAVLELFPDTWSPGYFLFKALLIVCMSLLALQALALLARSAIRLFRDPGIAGPQ
jgi:TRAP-type mannitol/chloroaromatic compound transport system permease small subunit